MLYALDDADLQQQIDGLVFMATPFFHFQLQDLDLGVIRALGRVVGFVSFGTIFVFSVMFAMEYLLWPNTVVVFASFGFTFGIIYVLGLVVDPIIEKWKPMERARDQCDTYQPPPPNKETRVLIVRKTGDEATTALVGGQLIELLVARVWKALVAPGKALLRLGEYKLGEYQIGQMIILIAIFAPIVFIPIIFSVERALVAGWIFLILMGIISVVAALQISLGIIIAFLNFIRFGWGDVITEALVRVSTEATPTGLWSVQLFVAEGGMMAHREVYQDPDVVQKIAHWIQQQ